MRTLIIDRFEGNFAICEESTQGKKKEKDVHFYGIERAELPTDAKEGDVLHISDEGEISVDAVQTRTRREILNEKQKLLKK